MHRGAVVECMDMPHSRTAADREAFQRRLNRRFLERHGFPFPYFNDKPSEFPSPRPPISPNHPSVPGSATPDSVEAQHTPS